MFVYLSKKIAVPNNTAVRCVSYNRNDGYIACGGQDGLLKVLKLEAQIAKDSKLRGLAAPSTLTMNQPLESHKGNITVLAWNDKHQRLTTGDQNGYIVVWVLHKGAWYEEMINSRNKAVVKSMKWNADGQKICIAYEEGGVIVGSVEGNRIWGKDLKNTQLTAVEWSPDGRLLLFGMGNGEVDIYDSNGNFLSKLSVRCTNTGKQSGASQVVAIDWYNGHNTYSFYELNCPTLAICFNNGRCQFMRHELDEDAVLLDMNMNITSAQWNHNGHVIAIAGSTHDSSSKDSTTTNVVHFYSPFGEHLRTLKVPGKELSSCSWEGGSLRLALAIDSFIYFANIRPEHKWCYFAETVVYTFSKPDRNEPSVVFWNAKTNEKFVKNFKNVLSMASPASGELCCITTTTDEESGKLFGLVLCNSIGSPLDSKFIEFTPTFLAMTSTHIVSATYTGFYVWQFKNIRQLATIEVAGRRKAGSERVYHIDDIPSGASGDLLDFARAMAPTEDQIRALTLSDKMLIVGRASGSLHQYSMPNLSLVRKYKLQNMPHRLSLNSSSSLLAIIDTSGVLNLFNLETKMAGNDGQDSVGELLQFEYKDVWDIKWAEDNSEMFAIMEKTKLCIFKGTEPEEPIISSGYICQFKDLEVKSVFLDEVLMQPETQTLDNIVIMEVKSLRDARNLLETAGIDDALKFIEANQHPRLWRLLAEHSLEKLNLKVAEHSFVRAKSYSGIQFAKRLANLQNESMKRAEIAVYFSRFDEAEKIYIEVDRKDLAIGLRKKLGDWFRVVQLLKSSSGGADLQLEEAYNAIGDYYADRQEWQSAVQFYIQGRNQERLAKCYYMVEDYEGLKRMTDHLPENHRLHPEIAEMFVTVGMCQEAANAYIKCNKVQQAIDTCVNLNQWNTAIELAKKHDIKDVDSLLMKYAQLLLQSKKTFSAVELYRKANHYLEAAKLMFQVAETESKKNSQPLRMKKLYVLAALLLEEYHDQMKNAQTQRPRTKRMGEASSALAGLLEEDSTAFTDAKIIDNAWRGAEAYHFYLLSQRQLYSGHLDLAMRTALRLREFEDIIDPVCIYSLLGLTSASVKAFSICSKAFIKLESLEKLTPAQRQQYEELALDIFTKNSAKDSKLNKVECFSCTASIPDSSVSCPECETKFPVCVVSGRSIFLNHFWMCPVCKHRAYEKEIAAKRNCPMCHVLIH